MNYGQEEEELDPMFSKEHTNWKVLTDTYLRCEDYHDYHVWAYGDQVLPRLRQFASWSHRDYVNLSIDDLEQAHTEIMQFHLEKENYELCILIEQQTKSLRSSAGYIQERVDLTTPQSNKTSKPKPDLDEFLNNLDL